MPKTAAQHGNTHRVQVAIADGVGAHGHEVAARRIERLAVHADPRAPRIARENRHPRRAHRLAPPSLFAQHSSVSTATRTCAPCRSSSGVNVRPSATGTPSTEK